MHQSRLVLAAFAILVGNGCLPAGDGGAPDRPPVTCDEITCAGRFCVDPNEPDTKHIEAFCAIEPTMPPECELSKRADEFFQTYACRNNAALQCSGGYATNESPCPHFCHDIVSAYGHHSAICTLEATPNAGCLAHPGFRCDGNIATWCEEGFLRHTIDCAADGRTCSSQFNNCE